ncbi:RsfA family transcriptional regulator [Rubeoparvulum massiliense]|uniref:RsfA family transcriptional regulator n=1 Tax=Rubeoparvulum massiliense TaxID=1631346 RepID=UPI00065E52D9|nr:RsfA family transcriptional regulator [Rubeoparvulum massiliense]
MTANRQDAWTPDDDLALAEVVLRHIREGSTQLAAFEEVAKKLSRTAAACGFRWNSAIRKKYDTAIAIAKAQRQQMKEQKRWNSREFSGEMEEETRGLPVMEVNEKEHESLTYSTIIQFLRSEKGRVEEQERRLKNLERKLEELQYENERLLQENQEIMNSFHHVEKDYRIVNDDYRTLLEIMDRARKMAIFGESSHPKSVFRMDGNGNLERVEK